MSHRSRKHKQQFDCGHRGFGQYCHRCADVERLRQAKRVARKAAKRQRQAPFEKDLINLRGLPQPIVKKARAVLAALSEGTHYWQLGGKRLHSWREVIRIPITRRYRLLCQNGGNRVNPVKVVSHEAYNTLVRKPCRLKQ
ncbi:DUF7682 family zinc-binding protein [Leptothoe sp. PORK10 BA2]|uniref:DUF7682 family zinc-binding protein n=1 Tax=Leptothoe sp. PORK10 BA2 TaxID=3110254 RepID=UPI002B1EC983|nr:hypothetical protein [Leptothoe sp. PORK10 BA2]MEA5466872.1 hypothetical protein [Leptothoe sp. PORK10 BA2]